MRHPKINIFNYGMKVVMRLGRDGITGRERTAL